MATSKNFTLRKIHHAGDSAGDTVYESTNLIATLTDDEVIHINDSAGNLLQVQPKKNDGGIDSDWSNVDQGIAYFKVDNDHVEG